MSKKTNNSPKSASSGPLTGTMRFFLGGCVAELYLLIIRRFYVQGTAVQMLAWFDYLVYFALGGLVILLAGLALALVCRADRKKRNLGWAICGSGAFLAVASGLIRLLNAPALNFLCVLVPVVMLLSILWSLYDRECAWALTILGVSLMALWAFRREMNSLTLGLTARIVAVAFIVFLIALALLARKADRSGGMLGKLRVLPARADVLPIYVACGVSAAAMGAALISSAVAYYAIWALAIVVFALAVYYTVKQL